MYDVETREMSGKIVMGTTRKSGRALVSLPVQEKATTVELLALAR